MRGLLAKRGLRGITLIFVLAGALLLASLEIPSMPGQLGPAFWPRVVLVLLLLSCAIKAIEILRTDGSKTEAAKNSDDEYGEVVVKKLLLVTGSMTMCVFLMDKIGFPLTILVFMFSFLIITGMKFGLSMWLVCFLGSISLVYLFVKLVYLPLPKGKWIFEDLTLIIYRVLHIM